MPPNNPNPQPQPGPGDGTQNQNVPPGNPPNQPPANNPPPPGNPPPQQRQRPDGTLYADLGVDAPPEPGSISPTWREDWAGGDAKKLAALQRFTEPKAVFDSLLAAQNRLRSGEYKRIGPPPLDNPEAMKAWRADNQVPETPDKYPMPLPKDFDVSKLPEDAKARIGHFQKGFHEMHLPAEKVEQLWKLYNDQVEIDQTNQTRADATLAENAEDTLRADWGRDFRGNIQANDAYLVSELGEELTDALMGARLPDGRLFMNLPEAAKWVNKMARAAGGDFIDPGVDQGAQGSVEKQLEDIRKIMNTDINRYYSEGWDKKYDALLKTQEKRGKLPDAAMYQGMDQ